MKRSKKRRLKREKKGENTKDQFSLLKGPTNKKHRFFFKKKRDSTNGNNTKTCLCVKKGKYVTGENRKGEKNDDQTKRSLQTKKRGT